MIITEYRVDSADSHTAADNCSSREIARRFVGELRETCRKLDTFPNAGGIPKDRIIRSAGYRFTVHKEYLIFYLVDEEEKQVNVMAIFNAKKDYMRVMKKYI